MCGGKGVGRGANIGVFSPAGPERRRLGQRDAGWDCRTPAAAPGCRSRLVAPASGNRPVCAHARALPPGRRLHAAKVDVLEVEGGEAVEVVGAGEHDQARHLRGERPSRRAAPRAAGRSRRLE